MSRNSDSQKKGRKPVFWMLILCLIIIIVCVAIVDTIVSHDQEQNMSIAADTTTAAELIEITAPQAAEQENMASIWETGIDEQIEVLVQRYFGALQEGDGDGLKDIIALDKTYEPELLAQEAELVESYGDIQCHRIKGLVEDTWFVYASCNIKFTGISQTAPVLISLYVCKDQDEAAYLSERPEDGEQTAYIGEIEKRLEVRELLDGADQALKNVCDTNKPLKKAVQRWQTIQKQLSA